MDDLNTTVLVVACVILGLAVWLGVKVNILEEENRALRRLIADERTHITLIDVNDKHHRELVMKNAREGVN